MDLWGDLERRYPGNAPKAQTKLELLLEARNGLAHADQRKIDALEQRGYSLSHLNTVRSWYSWAGSWRCSAVVMKANGVALGVGQRVRVRWGMGDAEGEVVEIYGTGVLERVMVRVPISGASGDVVDYEQFSLPPNDVHCI